MTKSDTRLICLGAISGAHGVRGQVRIRSYTALPEDIAAYGSLRDASGKSYQLKITGHNKGALIASIQGIETREAAEKLRNIELFVERSALPEPKKNEYYHADLIGLEVFTENNSAYGQVLSIQNFGAGNLIEIRLVTGKEEFLPLNKTTFPVIDVKNKKLIVSPPEII